MCSAPKPPKVVTDARPQPRDENLDEAVELSRKRTRSRGGLRSTVLTRGSEAAPPAPAKSLLGR